MRQAALLALTALAALLAAWPVRADVVHLADGTTLEAAPVGRDGADLVLVTKGGEVRVARADVASIESADASRALAQRAARARTRLLEHQTSVARALLRRLRKADRPAGAADDERAAVEAGLDGLEPEATVAPLEGALDDGAAPREVALARLIALGPPGQDPLLRAAMTASDPALRASAHAGAVAIDAVRARRVYEEVAASPARPIRRLRALQHLEALRDPASAPKLIALLGWVKTELRAQLATAGKIERVPVNLGTSTGAAVQAPIELPEMQLVEVATTITVPVLQVLGAETTRALEAISGEHHGDDVDAWERWWGARPDAQGRGGGLR
jgi:hypothetical protein